MNLLLLSTLYIIGMLCTWYELVKRKTPHFLIFIFIICFVLTAVSRIDNYFSYSDLGAYIYRFESGDDSYFGVGYRHLTYFAAQLFGTNSILLLTLISAINILGVLLAVKIISGNGIKFEKSMNIYRSIMGEMTKCRYLGTFLFIYAMYWGLSFSAEVIRTGLAITFSLLTIALLIKKKYLFAIIVYIVSIAFHWTEILLFPFLLIIVLSKNLKTSRFLYAIWLVILLFADAVDFSSMFGHVVAIPLDWVLQKLSVSSHYSVYLTNGSRSSWFSYLSEQYIFYRFIGFALLFGDIKNKKYNLFTFGYYIGLSIFTLFSVLEFAVIRMQWIYLILVIYAIYYFIKDNKYYSNMVKGLVVMLYTLLQTIMAILYLGYSF